MKKILSLTVFITSLLFQYNAHSQETSEDFDQMIEWLTGAFNSSDQAKTDPSFTHYTLKLTQIWPDAPNGAWIYVEQALPGGELNKQQVYFLSQINESQFSCDLYNIPGAERFVGAWENPEKFKGVTIFDLKYRNGCTLFLDYDGFQYSGATNTKTCKSDVEGVEYSTTQIILLPNEINLWEKGFDSTGKQVWGSTNSTYSFKKE